MEHSLLIRRQKHCPEQALPYFMFRMQAARMYAEFLAIFNNRELLIRKLIIIIVVILVESSSSGM